MKAKSIVVLLLFALNANQVHAQIWKPFTNAVGDVANTATKVVTAPTRTVIETARVLTGNGNPVDIFRPYQDLANSAGQSVTSATEAVTNPQKYLRSKAQSFASTAGPAGTFIFDVGTFTSQYYSDLTQSGLVNIGAALRGQNPLQLAAAPFAAAIRAARERHVQDAKAIPDDVKAGLRNVFSDSTLNRAKYATGDVRITLPNFIGKGQILFDNCTGKDENHAVTVDDIIVFAKTPPTFEMDPGWWAHEMTPVQQFEQMGVEGFAYRYATGWWAMEDEADVNRAKFSRNNPRPGNSYLRIGSYDMTSYRYEIDQRKPEYFVAQCFFPYDPFPVNYLVTNYGRIIAVDPMTGKWLHIGFATAPLASGVAWSYQTPLLRYAVRPDGAILTTAPIFDFYGRIIGYNYVQIGHVVRLA